MAEAMKQGRSHPYTKATAKERQNAPDWIPDDAISLVQLCEERGIDQEIVKMDEYLYLASKALEETI